MANNQGSAGIRFKLIDKSGFTSNVQTYPVVGIVGHSTKGPFNQIIGIESDDVAGAVIGTSGFNVGKYNFGLLGVKAALLGGGAADFVRLYNPASGRSLKTDAWTAYYETGTKALKAGYHYATTLDSGDIDSVGNLYMEKFTHGTRAINHITTVAASGQARVFDMDAFVGNYDYYTNSISTQSRASSAIPLFSIMAVDPTQVRSGDGMRVSVAQTTNLVHSLRADITVNASWTKYVYASSADLTDVNKRVISIGVGTNRKSFVFVSSAAPSSVEVAGATSIIINSSDIALSTEASRLAIRDAFVNALALAGYSPVKSALIDSKDSIYSLRYFGAIGDDLDPAICGNTTGCRLGTALAGDTHLVDYIEHTYTAAKNVAKYAIPAESVFTCTRANGITMTMAFAGANFSIDNVLKTITVNVDSIGVPVTKNGVNGTVDLLAGTVITVIDSNVAITASANTVSIAFSGTTTTAQIKFGIKPVVFNEAVPRLLNATPVLAEYSMASIVSGHMIGGTSLALPYLTVQQSISLDISGTAADIAKLGATQALKWYPTLVSSAVASGANIVVKGVNGYATQLNPVNSIPGVIVDQSIGSTFLGLNLATRQNIKNSSGTAQVIYVLNANGVVVADVYVKLTVTFGGVSKNYSGTIVPMAAGSRNLYIGEQFNQNSGYIFVVNSNDDYTDMAMNGDITLSQISGTSSLDHYIVDAMNNARWSYKPSEHNDSVGIQAAWRLFLDKDVSSVAYLCAAGTTVQNINTKYESLDHGVIASMLDVCAKRSTTFAFMDGLSLSAVDDVVVKSEGLNGYGFEQAMWGAIYDDRDKMDDVYYTRLTQEIPSSIGVTNRVVSNSGSGMWWLPPAGVANGGVPGTFASKGQKNHRSYNYSEDTNSDIAKLTAANINAKRQTKRGTVYYNEATLVQQNSVFQRVHASMFVAGMNRRFEELFEPDVFRLNDSNLRSNVEKSAQKVLDFALTASQPGITSGRAVCNSSNNTEGTLANRELILDIADLAITETAEKWTIRTTAIQSGSDGTVSTNVQLIKQ